MGVWQMRPLLFEEQGHCFGCAGADFRYDGSGLPVVSSGKSREIEHHDCLVYLEQADAEAQRLRKEMNSTQSENSQSIQDLRAENT
ncbi:hypothetical protein N7490_006556 [Penicillium lividum]|nr:hypothetical protein N7490_006556 [Penicillium lividum]